MSNNTHVTDVGGLVHKTTDLIFKIRALLLTYCEVTGNDREIGQLG
jgi:hypothetical protein